MEQVKSSFRIPANLGLVNFLPLMVLKKTRVGKKTHETFNAFIFVLEASDLPAFTNLTI